MSKSKENKYIGKELEWLEKQLNYLRDYVDDNPIPEMSDRIVKLSVGKNIVDKVTATVEQQIASVRTTLKEIPELLAAIEKLKEKEEHRDISVRGGNKIPHMMRT